MFNFEERGWVSYIENCFGNIENIFNRNVVC